MVFPNFAVYFAKDRQSTHNKGKRIGLGPECEEAQKDGTPVKAFRRWMRQV